METGISVACAVTSGIFMSEYIVKIEDKKALLWQGAVDKDMVLLESKNEPQKEKFIGGRIYAYLISFDANQALVELPVENVAGRRVSVPLSMVRKERVPA